MKYLAIDYGQKRTGIAVSDTGGQHGLSPQNHPHAYPRRLF